MSTTTDWRDSPLADWFSTLDETWDRVGDGDPAFVSFFRRRAKRRCLRLNRRVAFPSYRWEIVREGRRRWAVVAFQNLPKT